MNNKIKTKEELKEIIQKEKKTGKRIVATNGTFDILHPAHLRILKKAKSLGDVLVVLLNSDVSIRKFKGKRRPIVPEKERAETLSSLPWVDYLTLFNEDNPLKLIEFLEPHVLAKGAAFLPERLKEEKKLMEKLGGQLKTFPLEKGYSTTKIIQRVLENYSDRDDASNVCAREIFNRDLLKIKPLAERISKSDLSIMIDPELPPQEIENNKLKQIKFIAEKVKEAKKEKRPVILAFGAHLIKNGLSLITINLMRKGFLTHLVTNGASAIHDWEFAYQGKTEEDVEKYIKEGQFGLWEETGKYINLAISQNRHLGYGKAVGKLIFEEKLGEEKIRHPYRDKSIFSTAYELNIPISVCPGIGYDIIYMHPLCEGAAIGRAAYIDFLKLAKTISDLRGGVYISVGSAITSPMIFEKSLSMAQNLALEKGKKMENYMIAVNDIQPSDWDWSKGEPPKNNPAYYLRFSKTFSRIDKQFIYIQLDNRDFLHNLYALLKS